MNGRDVTTDINVTIFSLTINGAMQTSHLPICYASTFMPNKITVETFEWQLHSKPSEHKSFFKKGIMLKGLEFVFL